LWTCADIGELMRVVESFLAARTDSEIRILSSAGVSPACGSSDELREIVVRLAVARASAAACAGVPRALTRLFAFFTDATSRLANLELASRLALQGMVLPCLPRAGRIRAPGREVRSRGRVTAPA